MLSLFRKHSQNFHRSMFTMGEGCPWISQDIKFYSGLKGELCGTSMVVQWQRLHVPNVGRPRFDCGWGTRSRMPQLRIYMLQLKILHAATKKNPHAASKTWCSQIND